MPTVRRTRQWSSKPPMVARLNTTRPLAQSLQFFASLNEGVGPNIRDDVFGVTLNHVNAPTWGAGQAGSGLNCTSVGQGAIATLPPYMQVALPMTLAVGWKYAGTPVSAGPFIGILNNNGATNPRVLSLECDTGSTAIKIICNATVSKATTSTISTLVDHVAVATVTAAGAVAIYVDGALASSDTAATLPAYSLPSIALGMGGAFYSARNINAIIYWAAMWSRNLVAAEAIAVSESPTAIWRIFQPAQGRWQFPSTGAAPTFLPAWASQQPVLGVGVY